MAVYYLIRSIRCTGSSKPGGHPRRALKTLFELGGGEPPQESSKYVPLPDAPQQPAALAVSTARLPGGG